MTPDQGQAIGRTDAGNTEHSAPPFNGILLTERQVWAGMRVSVVMEGRGQVMTDKDGNPLVLDALLSGVPIRVRFFPVEDGIQSFRAGGEGFKPEVRFIPTEAYSPAEAPSGTEFAVFKDGKAVGYGKRPNARAVVVKIDDEGTGSLDNHDYGWLEDHPEFSLPEGVVLVPIGRPRFPEPVIYPLPTLAEREIERRVVSQLFSHRSSAVGHH